MGYKLGTKYPPGFPMADCDLWTQEIDYDGPSFGDMGRMESHEGCIEIHADSEELLNKRVRAIMFGLGLLQPDT
jgi:hypothetical protein